MFGFVVAYSFVWVVWALSPLAAPAIGHVDNPIPDMAGVLCVAGLAIVIAAHVHRSRLFMRRIGTRFGIAVAIALFALTVYPPVDLSSEALLSQPAEASRLSMIVRQLLVELLEAYTLQGLVLAVASVAWITALLFNYPRQSEA